MYIDELIEKAFCDGYEYAQREFNSKAMKEINNSGRIQKGKWLGNHLSKNFDNTRALKVGRALDKRRNEGSGWDINSLISGKAHLSTRAKDQGYTGLGINELRKKEIKDALGDSKIEEFLKKKGRKKPDWKVMMEYKKPLESFGM